MENILSTWSQLGKGLAATGESFTVIAEDAWSDERCVRDTTAHHPLRFRAPYTAFETASFGLTPKPINCAS
ncbi:MAG: hypothetical protein AAB134_07670, partial [Pseudomonadota bacterium]